MQLVNFVLKTGMQLLCLILAVPMLISSGHFSEVIVSGHEVSSS